LIYTVLFKKTLYYRVFKMRLSKTLYCLQKEEEEEEEKKKKEKNIFFE